MTPSPRIVLITGAKRGIGRSAALHLARDGVDVILTYRSHVEEADEVVAEPTELGRSAVAFQLDTGVAGSFDAFAERVREALRETWSRDTFNFLVNNGGMKAKVKATDRFVRPTASWRTHHTSAHRRSSAPHQLAKTQGASL